MKNPVKLKEYYPNLQDIYTLLPSGYIYNSKTKREITGGNRHQFSLKTEDNKTFNISVKKLYKTIYGENFYDKSYEVQLFCDEILKDVTDDIKCSNYGRIIDYRGYIPVIRTGWQKQEAIKKNKKLTYTKVCINNNTYNVARLVYQLFGEPIEDFETLEIHHKDGCKQNNHINNLLPVSREQHQLLTNIQRMVKDERGENSDLQRP